MYRLGVVIVSLILFTGFVSADISSSGVEVEEIWSSGILPYHDVEKSGDTLLVEEQYGDIEAYDVSGSSIWDGELGEALSVHEDKGYTFIEECVERVIGSCVESEYYISEWDVSDGDENWRLELDNVENVRHVEASEDLVLMGGDDSTVVAVDKASRDVSWTHDYHDARISSIEIGENTVYTGDFDGRIVAVEKGTGDIRWDNTELTDGVINAVRDIYEKGSGVYATGTEIISVSDTGETEWEYIPEFGEDLNRFVVWSMKSHGENKVVMTDDGNFIGLDLDEREELWNFVDDGRSSASAFVLEENELFAAGVDGDIVKYAFEAIEEDEEVFEDVDITIDDNFGRSYSFSTEVDSENSIDRIEWSFGEDDGTKFGRNVVHDFSEPGDYIVGMTARDAVGEETSTNITVSPEIDLGRPDASVILPQDEYNAQTEGEVEISIAEEGEYSIDISGGGLDYSESFEEDEVPDTMTVEPEREGELEARIYAPGGFWDSIIGVLPGVEGDKLVDQDSEVVRSVPGSVPEVELEGDTYIVPDGVNEELPELTYTAEIDTDPEHADIIDYEWSVVGVLDDYYTTEGNEITVDWEEGAHAGLYIIELEVEDEYGRESGKAELEVDIEESSISVPDSPDNLGEEATIEVEVTQEIAENGYEIDIFGLNEVDYDTSDSRETVHGEQEYTWEYEPEDTGRYRVFLRDSPDGLGNTLDEAFFYLGDDAPVGDADLQITDLDYPSSVEWHTIPIDFTVENTGEHGEDTVELFIDGEKMTQTIVALEEGEEETDTLESFTDEDATQVHFEVRTPDDSETGNILITQENEEDDEGSEDGDRSESFDKEEHLPQLSNAEMALEFKDILTRYTSESEALNEDNVQSAKEDFESDEIRGEDLAVIQHFNSENLVVEELLSEVENEVRVQQSGGTTSIVANVHESVASNGYSVEIRDSESNNLIETKQSTQTSETVEVDIEEEGVYRAEIRPQQGIIARGISLLPGINTEVFADSSFIIGDQERDENIEQLDPWREYCERKEYDTTSASERISCIQGEISNECLQQNPSGQCRDIAESACDYYLNTGFNPESGTCETS